MFNKFVVDGPRLWHVNSGANLIMAKVQKDSPTKGGKGDGQAKKSLAVKGAEADVDVKTAEAELAQDDLAAFKADKKRQEEEGISRMIKDVTARKSATSNVSLENFDWEAFDKKGFGEGYSTKERQDMDKIYGGTIASVSESEVVKGTVVGINDRDVI